MYAAYTEDKEEVKIFFNKLFREDVFDGLCVRSCEITTLVNYNIDGKINKLWDEDTHEDNYCKLRDIKQNVLSLIKGKKMPQSMKIQFSVPTAGCEKIHPNAKALFINVVFEENKLTIISGFSEREFSMDRAVDHYWSEWLKKFMKKVCILQDL